MNVIAYCFSFLKVELPLSPTACYKLIIILLIEESLPTFENFAAELFNQEIMAGGV